MILQTRFRHGWVLAAALLLMHPALAQDDRFENEVQAPPEEDSTPVFSLNISSQLLYQGIDLLVEKRLTKDYGFDEFQAEEMRLLLREKLPKFLAKYQAELEILATEWLEAASASEPPTPEFAAAWAARLRPIVEDTELMVDGLFEDMREFLNDDQQVLLNGFQAAARVATRNAKGRLHEFEQGYFDPEIHWVRKQEVRRRGPEDIARIVEDMETARGRAMGEFVEPLEQPVRPEQPVQAAARSPRPTRAAQQPAPAKPEQALVGDETVAVPVPEPESTPAAAKTAKAGKDEPKDNWTLYVEAFIERYQLNGEQQQKAGYFLKRAQADRLRYMTRSPARMERITSLWKNAKTDPERETAQKANDEWQRPLDRMFERFSGKLETLPTRQQRRAATTSKVTLPEPGKPAKQAAADKKRPK